MTQLSDEILIAYADGELGPSQIRVVDGVLASDRVTNKQFAQVQLTNKRLSQAFATMLQAQARQGEIDRAPREDKSVPQGQKLVGKKRPGLILAPAIAASIVLIGVGALGGLSGWKYIKYWRGRR